MTDVAENAPRHEATRSGARENAPRHEATRSGTPDLNALAAITDADQRGEHVERQDHGRDPLERPAVRSHRWDHHEDAEREQAEDARAGPN